MVANDNTPHVRVTTLPGPAPAALKFEIDTHIIRAPVDVWSVFDATRQLGGWRLAIKAFLYGQWSLTHKQHGGVVVGFNYLESRDA